MKQRCFNTTALDHDKKIHENQEGQELDTHFMVYTDVTLSGLKILEDTKNRNTETIRHW